MARDKEIKLRNKNNEQILNRIKEICPGASFKEFSMIPYLSGYIIWEGFQDMDSSTRIFWLNAKLGELGTLPSMLWCRTPFEWELYLEDKDFSDMD